MFGIDEQYHPTIYWACGYLSMLGWKFIYVSKGAPEVYMFTIFYKASFRNAYRFSILNAMTFEQTR